MFEYWIIIWIVLVLIINIPLWIFLYLKSKRKLDSFPDLSITKINYRDKMASGNSNKSIITKFGGASRVLDVIVTDNEILIKSHWLLNIFGVFYDLIHNIPFTSIISISIQRKKITIEFRNTNLDICSIVISTKKPDEFVRALGSWSQLVINE